MENKKELQELIEGWEKLYTELRKNKKINFELFENTFSKTYKTLLQCANEEKIQKDYIALIVNAYLFTEAGIKEMDLQYRAALVLTERMLNSCVMSNCPVQPEGAMVYVLESHKEVYINFGDVITSLDTLTKLFEGDFWGSR